MASNDLETIREAIGTHAAIVGEGSSTLKQARTLRDKLSERQRKVAKEKKLAEKKDDKKDDEKKDDKKDEKLAQRKAERTETKD